jgi:hypothetical protein
VNVRARLAKLELIQGGRVPTDNEFQDAARLLNRHFDAIGAPEIFGVAPDPQQVALMRAAEAAGEIAKARDIERRWKRAHGYCQQTMPEIVAWIEEAFPEESATCAEFQELKAKVAAGWKPEC